MREALRAGVAIYNDGHFHAAHDAWEDRWLDLESGTDDERLLHGLIQFTAAVYHAHERNWEGATGLAGSAGEYLAPLPEGYRGIDLPQVRRYLAVLAADPGVVDRRPPVRLVHEGTTPRLEDLDVGETAIAAGILAEEFGYDRAPVEAAIEYARTDLEAGRTDSRFVSLLFAFVREDDRRATVHRRLADHVDRRRAREGDVDGLF